MRIGIDLDNTIINYNALFHFAALGHGLISRHVPAHKATIKHYIQTRHDNDVWTRLQAEVYGPLIDYAEPYAGIQEFLGQCHRHGYPACILSHKTRRPASGEDCDLRAAALGWLESQGWFSSAGLGLRITDVEFHDTRSDKIAAIQRRACDTFIDDLPEVLADPDFPSGTSRILFDPARAHPQHPEWKHAQSWADITAEIFSPVAA